MKYVCHFSCGAASAVAALLTISKQDDVELIYSDPGAEHKDNKRFLHDFEALTGKIVTIVKSNRYADIFEVFESKRYLSGVNGSPCTTEMKKLPIQEYLGRSLYDVTHVFGYTIEEKHRVLRYNQNNPLMKTSFPIIDEMLNKSDCLSICSELGLELPMMYKLGYANANCTGCVKSSSIGYWAAIRADFPDIFQWYAKKEREFGKNGVAMCKSYRKATQDEINTGVADKQDNMRLRIFLDEIPEDYPIKRNISFTCGYTCGSQDMDEIQIELTKEPSLLSHIVGQNILNSLKTQDFQQ